MLEYICPKFKDKYTSLNGYIYLKAGFKTRMNIVFFQAMKKFKIGINLKNLIFSDFQ